MSGLLESETSFFKSTGNLSIYLGSFDLVLLHRNADVGISSFKQLMFDPMWTSTPLSVPHYVVGKESQRSCFADFIPFFYLPLPKNLGFLTF